MLQTMPERVKDVEAVCCKLHGIRLCSFFALTLCASLCTSAYSQSSVIIDSDVTKRRAQKNDFDAQAQISCSQERGEPIGECTANIARGADGDATVVVSFPNGFKRALYFLHGKFISANATMSGSGSDTDWEKVNGLHIIRVDDQRYELRDDFIFGR